MKKLSSLKGVKILGRAQQKSIHGGAATSCDDSCSVPYLAPCTYTCNGYTYKGRCQHNNQCIAL